MNFLEELASEHWGHMGYFVCRNVKAEKGRRGGYAAELDVLAYHPKVRHLVHIETSSRVVTPGILARKFRFKKSDYERILNVDINDLQRIAIHSGRSHNGLVKVGDAMVLIENQHRFVGGLATSLTTTSPHRSLVPESYPLLRAIQLAAWNYGSVDEYGRARRRTKAGWK